MLHTSFTDSADVLKMYSAAKAVYEKEILMLEKVVSNKILSAHIFFTCKEQQSQNAFSHQVLYNHNTAGIPPELVDFLKLHIDALKEAVAIIETKVRSLQTITA